jgi:phage terminase large subunit-like protein
MTRRSRSRSRRSGSSLADIARRVPGYDAFETAGDCTFDAEAAQLACDFFRECLVHVKGELAGQPFRLRPWQKAIVANVFGWKRPDGTRRYREVFIEIARKNGKTTLVAGLVLFILFCDHEPGAEVYSAAGEREQAALLHDLAKQMVLHEPALASRAKLYSSPRSIVLEHMGSVYKPLSSDADTKYGFNTHCAVVDELHVQRTRRLVDALQTSMGSRRQPLLIHITTAGYDVHSICYEKYDYACKIRDGVFDDPSFLPVIYEAGPEDDWTKVRTWRKANPNYGVSVSREFLRSELKRAQRTPSYENTFRRLYLDQWTEQSVRWLPLDAWDECDGPVDFAALAGQPCWAGIDLSSTTDLTALVLLWILGDGTHVVAPWFFLPQANAQVREERDRVPYLTWARQGLIELTPGNVVDYERVRARLHALAERFEIQEVAIDRWNATHMITLLDADGLNPVPFGQGYASMSAPTKELEKLVLGAQLAHGGHPVLRWNANNAAVAEDAAGNKKPDKKRSRDRIDGIVATIMALGRAMIREPVGAGRSVYEDRGVIAV